MPVDRLGSASVARWGRAGGWWRDYRSVSCGMGRLAGSLDPIRAALSNAGSAIAIIRYWASVRAAASCVDAEPAMAALEATTEP
jgi:hypothetical protein